MINKASIIKNMLPEVLLITSYPPRECGIATYSQDLKRALTNQFGSSFSLKICALESDNERHNYTDDVRCVLDVDKAESFSRLSEKINNNPVIRLVIIQHEFGFFSRRKEEFLSFMSALTKPIIIVFHTILPHPDDALKRNVQTISGFAESVIVMTVSSAEILIRDYAVQRKKITIIPHGTHLIQHLDQQLLKSKYQLQGKKVLSTFGLLSPGKSIETTLNALPGIISIDKDIVFLIIGKTHPSVVKQEGEKYRRMLATKVDELKLQEHVRFINHFLPLSDLLEYLQLTDIYLFTSRDPNQAVSGTFSYAISCGCPVISTPIPHAHEVLKGDAGVIFDFENSEQLGKAIIRLLQDETLRRKIGSNGLHRMASTAWENASIAHAILFEKIGGAELSVKYNVPPIRLDYLKKMTTYFGILQFSVLNSPSLDSGYTLDDNARALIAMCRHFELTGDRSDIKYIKIYFYFIKYCQQTDGCFLNYVDEKEQFTEQNNSINLEDSTGRAIWGLGYLLSLRSLLPAELISEAELVMQEALPNVEKIHSSRAMGFIIKGLYYRNLKDRREQDILLVRKMANRLVQMYRHEQTNEWRWFESYLTYANSIMPEALLLAGLLTDEATYKDIARTTVDFLLANIFTQNRIKVISNKGWLYKDQFPGVAVTGGEQPIDVAYTILALKQFDKVFNNGIYSDKIRKAFNWFLGNNHLHQIIYNPCTGGCYDGLEETHVNLNQGAESTISYLLARLEMEDDKLDLKTTYSQAATQERMNVW
jgi:glycosyltransferase involved in cell wall biosynthesis